MPHTGQDLALRGAGNLRGGVVRRLGATGCAIARDGALGQRPARGPAVDVRGADHADLDALFPRLLDHGTHRHVGIAAKFLGHDRHDVLHIVEFEIWSAAAYEAKVGAAVRDFLDEQPEGFDPVAALWSL